MYSAKISRENRTAFIIMCDQSGSMAEKVSVRGEIQQKSDAVSLMINMIIDEIINRSRRSTGVMDYFDIAVIGYSGDGVIPLLSADSFTKVSELVFRHVELRHQHILRTLPGGNQISATVERKCWIQAAAKGNTPMYAALRKAEELTNQWCSEPSNRNSFPPIIINITDGEASDGTAVNLIEISDSIKSLSTNDGKAIFFNIHLATTHEKEEAGVSFPGTTDTIPSSKYADLLYEMSSILPECYNELILQSKPDCRPPLRAVSYNCPIDELFSMLAIGTVSSSFTV